MQLIPGSYPQFLALRIEGWANGRYNPRGEGNQTTMGAGGGVCCGEVEDITISERLSREGGCGTLVGLWGLALGSEGDWFRYNRRGNFWQSELG